MSGLFDEEVWVREGLGQVSWVIKCFNFCVTHILKDKIIKI